MSLHSVIKSEKATRNKNHCFQGNAAMADDYSFKKTTFSFMHVDQTVCSGAT